MPREKGVDKTMIVHSSHGDIEIDFTGVPLNFDVDSDDNALRKIVRFDIQEYSRHYNELVDESYEFDILDLGYWYKDDSECKYEKPEEQFRREVQHMESGTNI